MYSVQSVQKDQVIAIYHPAVKEQMESEFPESRFCKGTENREHFAELVLDEVRISLPIFADGWED